MASGAASSRSASQRATDASLTGGAFQAPSDLDARHAAFPRHTENNGGGGARLHLLRDESNQLAILVHDLAIAVPALEDADHIAEPDDLRDPGSPAYFPLRRNPSPTLKSQ